MSNIEQVIDQIRTFAGADFAFVLTRRGRLVTRGAPRDMPEVGRIRLVTAAEPLVGSDSIGEITIPREELVPFGGAAPVDVYVAVAAEKAIICVVMATWAAKIRVAPAIKAGVRALLPLLEGRGPASARRRRHAEGAGPESRPPASRIPASKPPVSRPPVSRPPETQRGMPPRPPETQRGMPPRPPEPQRAMPPRPPESQRPVKSKRAQSGLLNVSGPTTHASPVLERPPEIKSAPPPAPARSSLPSILVGEATLGRESLAAIEAEMAAATRPPSASMPAISVGEAQLGRESLAAIEAEMAEEARRLAASLPTISVDEAQLGRESLAAIERESGSSRGLAASLPTISIGEATLGRESLAAIDSAARPPQTSMPDNVRITLVSANELPPDSTPKPDSKRVTQPWVESPADAKRYADAARLGRKLAPPKVTLKLEEVDGSLIDSEPDPSPRPPKPPAGGPSTSEARAGKRRR